MQHSSTSRQYGFTVVELVVVITVLGILIGLVLSTLGSFYQSNIDSLGRNVQQTDTRSVLRTIENDLTSANRFLKTTTMTPLSPTGTNDDTTPWDYKGNGTNRVLIANAYATDKPQSDDTRSLVYINGGSCSPTSATPLQYNLVYFVRQDPLSGQYNLYRRTMLPPDPQCPPGARQKQTCTSTKLTPAYPNCIGSDAILLFNITGFTVSYYDTASSNDPILDQYGSADITTAKSVELTVTTTRKINGQPTDFTSNIRISRFN